MAPRQPDIVHERIAIGMPEPLPEDDRDRARFRVPVESDVGGETVVEVHVTGSSDVGPDVLTFVRIQLRRFASGLPNDGRKIERLRSSSPIAFDSRRPGR